MKFQLLLSGAYVTIYVNCKIKIVIEDREFGNWLEMSNSIALIKCSTPIKGGAAYICFFF